MPEVTAIFRTLPLPFLISLVVLGESVVVWIAGFASDYWLVDDDLKTYGLWRWCETSSRTYGRFCVEYVPSGLPSYMWGTRLCAIASFINQVVAIVELLLFAYKQPRKNWALGAAISCACACVLTVISVAVFLSNSGTNAVAGWSGVIAIFSAIMQAHSAVLIFVPMQRGQVAYVEPTPALPPQGAPGYLGQYQGPPPQGYQGYPPQSQYQGQYQGATYQGPHQGYPQGYPQGHPPQVQDPPRNPDAQPSLSSPHAGSESNLVAPEN